MVERAREVEILEAAQRLGAELKRHGHEWVGHCPAGCTKNGDGFSVNARKGVFLCRPSGGGGDVIRLVEHVRGLDFKEAVAFLCQEEWPAPVKRDRAKDEAEDNRHREKQIRIARGLWERGLHFLDTLAEGYLAARGLDALPAQVPLRYFAAQPYWREEDYGKDDAKPIHVGPAMLAAITDPAGAITGCHITWLDAERIGDKATILDPDTGARLDAKKVRGSKRKAAIRLIDRPGSARLVDGEGIETTLSVYIAERVGLKASATSYWSLIDLGHMGGKPAESIEHPTKLNAKTGRPLRVGGPWPEAQAERDVDLPDYVTEAVHLGDGDSDRFATEMALRRQIARWERPGLAQKIAWAPDGRDFNDVLRAAHAN